MGKKTSKKTAKKKAAKIDRSRWPIDPKAVYSVTGEWRGYKALFGKNVCDDCGNEDCECANLGAMHSVVVAIAVEHNGYLPPEAVNELAFTHENLSLTAVYSDGEETYLAKDIVNAVSSRMEDEDVDILGVRLAYNESELVEMGLL